MPSRTLPADGLPAPSASVEKYSVVGPRERATPNPWLLCILRLSAAISPVEAPSSG